MFEKVFG